MTPQSPREKAIYSWDSAVLNLKSSVTQYSFQSSLLFNHLNAEDEKTLDIPLEDALVHIDMQLHEIAHVQEQLHKSKIRMQVRELAIFDPFQRADYHFMHNRAIETTPPGLCQYIVSLRKYSYT